MAIPTDSIPIVLGNTAGSNNINRYMWTEEETKIFFGLNR